MKSITLEALQSAMRLLKEKDAEMDGRLYCYEWEAKRLLAAGARPEQLVVIPSKIPEAPGR